MSCLQKALLLGFKTHSEFVLDMRMAKKPENVAKFLKDLGQKLKPLKENDIKTFLKYKKEDVSSRLSSGLLHSLFVFITM